MSVKQKSETLQIWDPLIRISHWVLAVAFLVAYFTEDDFLSTHVWAGYTVGFVILIRIVWGFIGTQHARFADFICSPIKSIKYFVELIRGRSKRYLGHSPAGAAMIVLLILGVVATGWTGVMVYAYEEQAGPMATFVMPRTGITSPEAQSHDDERFEKNEEFWEEAHEISANLTLALVLLHILGVLLASRVHHENLVRSMVTGRKPVQRQER